MDWGQSRFPGRAAAVPWPSASLGEAGAASQYSALATLTFKLCDQLVGTEPADQANPFQKLARLDARIGLPARQELFSLAEESDPELWAVGLLHLASRLQEQDQDSAALFLLENLIALGEQLPSEAAYVVETAKRRQQAWSGGGRIGDRAEVLLGNFVEEASDPATLAAFLVGGTAYKLGRGYLLGNLAVAPASFFTRGAGARLLAAGGAFGLEVPSFLAASKLGNQALGRPQDWSSQNLERELLATGLTLFFLKSSGAAASWAGNGIRGAAALQAAPGIARFSEMALPQIGMFSGIVLGHGVAARLGLRPTQSSDHFLLDALATLMQFNVGGKLGDSLLGPGYARSMREVEIRASLPPRPPRVSLLPEAALAGAATNPRPSEAPRISVMQMSSNDNRDDSKVIPLFPNGNGRKTPEPQILDAASKVRLRDQLVHQVNLFMNEMAANFGKFLSDSEVYASYLERGMADSPAVEQLRLRLKKGSDNFLEHYGEATSFQRDLTAFAFGHPEAMVKGSKYEMTRGMLRDFVSGGKPLLQAFEMVRGALQGGDVSQAFQALKIWHRFTPYSVLFERSHALDFGRDASELISATRLLGMAYGHSAADILADPVKPLSAQSSPMKKLLEGLEKAGDRPYSRILLERYYPKGEGVPTPREGLAFGGSFDRPFHSWLSLHLPALLLHQGGSVGAVEQLIRPIELFMDPSTREIGREALRWLGFALQRQGSPMDWARDASSNSAAGRAFKMARHLDPNPERLAKNLGVGGPKAILAHSLHAFLRGHEEPAQTLGVAMQAPEAIREEVLNLSGALSGAYSGRGGLNSWNLLANLRETFPNREIGETMLRSWEEKNLALPLGSIARTPGRSLNRAPWPRMLQSAEKYALKHPDWIAFQDGFFERQSEIELIFHNVVQGGTELLTRDPKSVAADVIPVREKLLTDLKKIEAGVESLRKYFKEGGIRLRRNGLPLTLSQPLWKELQDRLDRIETGLRCYRGFLAALQFGSRAWGQEPKPNELQAIRDELFRVIEAFQVPEGAPVESSVAKVLMEVSKQQLEMAKAGTSEFNRKSESLDAVEEAAPSRKQEKLAVSDNDWVKNLVSGIDLASSRGKIVKFWAAWAEAKGLEISPQDRQGFERALERFPAYFIDGLAYRSVVDPLSTKALLLRLELLPSTSRLGGDIEIREALAERSSEKIESKEMERIKRGILSTYDTQAAVFFPETYQPLSAAERVEWESKIETLPPILARALNDSELRSAEFLALAHELGLSKLGVPAFPVLF